MFVRALRVTRRQNAHHLVVARTRTSAHHLHRHRRPSHRLPQTAQQPEVAGRQRGSCCDQSGGQKKVVQQATAGRIPGDREGEKPGQQLQQTTSR